MCVFVLVRPHLPVDLIAGVTFLLMCVDCRDRVDGVPSRRRPADMDLYGCVGVGLNV